MASKSNRSKSLAVDDEWQIESDLRTLARAREIKADPKRMKAVQELAQKQLTAAAAAAATVSEKA